MTRKQRAGTWGGVLEEAGEMERAGHTLVQRPYIYESVMMKEARSQGSK